MVFSFSGKEANTETAEISETSQKSKKVQRPSISWFFPCASVSFCIESILTATLVLFKAYERKKLYGSQHHSNALWDGRRGPGTGSL
ncbi:MAG: hypothetical protein KAQ78_09630, partial [Candidatus Latescibacteria bacterium]|nr:hypothetical protein [Candidatus Latescibacterota bacterium]